MTKVSGHFQGSLLMINRLRSINERRWQHEGFSGIESV